jgi:hypothetical protein
VSDASANDVVSQPDLATALSQMIARSTSFLKASGRHSEDLSDNDKLAVKPGDVLIADLAEGSSHFWAIRNASLNGIPVPAHIGLAHRQHWDAPQPIPSPTPAVNRRGEALALLSHGLSVTAVSKRLGVPRNKVKNWRVSAGSAGG